MTRLGLAQLKFDLELGFTCCQTRRQTRRINLMSPGLTVRLRLSTGPGGVPLSSLGSFHWQVPSRRGGPGVTVSVTRRHGARDQPGCHGPGSGLCASSNARSDSA
eukprot:2121182-Rhodomonas_salina.2